MSGCESTIGSEGVYRVRVSERVWPKANVLPGLGCESAGNRPGAGSELNGHPRGYEHEPRREEGFVVVDVDIVMLS